MAVQLVYTLIPGQQGFDFSKPNEYLDGCAVYTNCYGVSGGCGTGELGGFSSNTGGPHLSIGTFNSTLFVQNREAQWLMNTTSMEYMIIDVITGNDSNGGERPNDFGESLYLQCTTGGNGSVTKLANSGKDGGYTFPTVDNNGNWTSVTVNIPAANRGQFLWKIYAAADSPEFENSGGIYANNQNAGDRFAISQIRIYGEVPTNLSYFRANDNYPSTQIEPGNGVVFTWDTTLGSFSTCTSGTLYQVNANGTETTIYNIPANEIDNNNYVLFPGPTVASNYRLRVNGNSGPAQLDVEVVLLSPDDDPDLIQFDTVDAATPGQSYTSNTVTITGIGTSISCSASNGAEMSINGGGWVTSGTVSNGNTIRLRMTASGAYGSLKTTSVSVGGLSTTWKIITESEPANIPNAFSFNDVTGAELLSLVQSNTVTITGLNASTTVLQPSNNIFESKVGNGPWNSNAKSISNGQTLSLRVTTNANLGDTVSTNIVVGNSAAVPWNVTNKSIADDNPDYFDFPDIAAATANTLTQSNAITITGINVQTNIATTNGAQIQVNGGSWVSSPTTIVNNDTVRVRILSSSTPGGEVDSVITIGNTPTTTLSDPWKVTTTTSGDIIPDDFFFIDKDDQVPGTYVESNVVLIQGITSPSPLNVSNGEARVNGGSWITSGLVNNGDTLQVRMITPATVSTAKALSITIG